LSILDAYLYHYRNPQWLQLVIIETIVFAFVAGTLACGGRANLLHSWFNICKWLVGKHGLRILIVLYTMLLALLMVIVRDALLDFGRWNDDWSIGLLSFWLPCIVLFSLIPWGLIEDFFDFLHLKSRC
jgi:hypothetical protein